MRRSLRVLPVMAVATLLFTGCERQSPLCAEAVDYYELCTGQVATAPSSCGASEQAAASELMATGCDALLVSDKSDLSGLACLPHFLQKGYGDGSKCCWNYNCDGSLACIGSRCKAKLVDGQRGCDNQFDCAGYDLTCFEGKCEAKHKAGEACADYVDCESRLICWDSICEQPHGAGGVCTNGGDCEIGTFCNPDKRCQILGDVGASCESWADCDSFKICWNGTCQNQRADGDSCGSDHDCDGGLICWDSVCEPEHQAGGACRNWADCDMGLICFDSVCASRHGEGEVCNDRFDCDSGLDCSDAGLCVKR
jgi:hypothetical protein